jgi:hypothetical protein
MSLECRKSLARCQLESGVGLSTNCLRHILITQALVHNPDVYNKMLQVMPMGFSEWYHSTFDGKPWVMNPKMQTGAIGMLTKVASGVEQEELGEGEDIVSLISAYVNWAAKRLPSTVRALNEAEDGAEVIEILQLKLKLPVLRALQVARFLKYCSTKFADFSFDVVGQGAVPVVGDILGIPESERKTYRGRPGDLERLRDSVIYVDYNGVLGRRHNRVSFVLYSMTVTFSVPYMVG